MKAQVAVKKASTYSQYIPSNSKMPGTKISPNGDHVNPLQGLANRSPQTRQAMQLQAMANHRAAEPARGPSKVNHTGLPGDLKTGVEKLSGYSMDDVKVHYNSDKPARLHAHAYAHGTDIHLAPGQEKHLPHEAWHVVQQKQRRVKPILQMMGTMNINDDAGLEKEADVMGSKSKEVGQKFLFNELDLDDEMIPVAPGENVYQLYSKTNVRADIADISNRTQAMFIGMDHYIAHLNNNAFAGSPVVEQAIRTLGSVGGQVLEYELWDRVAPAGNFGIQANRADITTTHNNVADTAIEAKFTASDDYSRARDQLDGALTQLNNRPNNFKVAVLQVQSADNPFPWTTMANRNFVTGAGNPATLQQFLAELGLRAAGRLLNPHAHAAWFNINNNNWKVRIDSAIDNLIFSYGRQDLPG